MKMLIKYSWLIIVILLANCTQSNTPNTKQSPTEKREISRKEAITLAENYVLRQGYTNKKIDWRKEKIVFDANEFATDTAKLVQLRYNTLLPNAIGARTYVGEQNAIKWAVGFDQTVDEPNIGRTVIVDQWGTKIAMSAKKIQLSWIEEADTLK